MRKRHKPEEVITKLRQVEASRSRMAVGSGG
jgi:hypothetical protein